MLLKTRKVAMAALQRDTPHALSPGRVVPDLAPAALCSGGT